MTLEASRRFTALVTDGAFDDLAIERSVLEPIGCAVVAHRSSSGVDLLTMVGSVDGLLVNRAPITETVIDQAPSLKVVARYGVGVDNIDIDAAASRGIAVTNVPDYCVDEVAEYVIALILACARQVVRLDRIVHGGRWSPADISPTRRLAGSVLGLVGLGRIGCAVATRASALGLTILAHDPFVANPPAGVTLTGLGELLATADFVSLHVPLTESTQGLIGSPEIRAMKPTAFLVNAARGALIDEAALYEGLCEGWIAGAALDVLAAEPPGPDHPLIGLDNVILTPHVAFYSEESLRDRRLKAALGVREVLLGRMPDHPVTPGRRRPTPVARQDDARTDPGCTAHGGRHMVDLDFGRFDALTFDCYGTLIDWEAGIATGLRAVLAPRGVAASDDELLEAFARHEAAAEAGEYLRYREVLVRSLRGVCGEYEIDPGDGETTAFSESVGDWPAFPDSAAALARLAQRFRLGVITNCDDDLFASSNRRLGVTFDWVVTAQQASRYKPDLRVFELAFERIDVPRERILHVAQSLFHDHVPAKRLGMSTVWIDRRNDKPGFGATPPASAAPDLTVTDMATFAELALR